MYTEPKDDALDIRLRELVKQYDHYSQTLPHVLRDMEFETQEHLIWKVEEHLEQMEQFVYRLIELYAVRRAAAMEHAKAKCLDVTRDYVEATAAHAV